MRKSLCIILLFVFAVSTAGFSQTLVVTTPTKANVVLEEYTGINCQYCPGGHTIAQELFNSNPGRVVLVNIHQGGYAEPSSGQPDYRTAFGDSLADQSDLNGYPAATVNRHLFPAYSMVSGSTAMGRSNWTAAGQEMMQLPSPVNVGLSSSFDTTTRLLTVTVETYYTASSPAGTNYINVALMENGIIGPQNVLGTMNNNYTHNHMLRHFITGQWGDTCTHTTSGSFNQRVYTYTVPAGINVAHCDVAAYVCQTRQEVYTGAQVPAIGGTTLVVAVTTAPPMITELGAPATATNFTLDLTSQISGAQDFAFEFNTDAPADWTAQYTIGSNVCTGDDTLSLTGSVANNITITVTPGSTPFIGTYELIARSVSNPMAPPVFMHVRVVSNITDLVLNNDEAWGDGGTTYSTRTFESNYLKGLGAASNTHYASTPKRTFMEVAQAGKLTEIEHIYFNVGWTFPSFTDDVVAVLATFLDNGGNLFVSGQDIAWDTWDAANGGNGTANTQAFFTNYLHAKFVNDGGTANSIMTPVSSDAVFSTLDTSNITNVYGGTYFYPDQIDTLGISVPVFYYNSNLAKMGGLRVTNGTYKIVYFAPSLEMIADTNIRKDVIHIAHDWFHGFISGSAEYDQAMKSLFMGQNYPNPADESTTIVFSNALPGASLEVYDLMGRKISETILNQTEGQVNLCTKSWKAGIYSYRLMLQDGSCTLKKLVIEH